jgi:aryl-alcohol dehydrogenase-like predicted oxidoreductase
MEFRQLGYSGLQAPVLRFGAGTEFFKAWGSSDVAEATRLVDICLDAGVNLFDTADVYSKGLSEETLGKAIVGKRNRVLISTKATFRMGDGPNDLGSSRHHLIQSCEESLRPSVVKVIIGARSEEQLRQNLAAIGWNLTREQVAKLDAASDSRPAYPYWHQRQFADRNPVSTSPR